MSKYNVGDKVNVGASVKDAVIVQIVRRSRAAGKTLYLVEYTIDDELERRNPTGRRHCQPWFESSISLSK